MDYSLSPAQKRLLSKLGESPNFSGDDAEFSIYMGRLCLEQYMAGNKASAWDCYQNDPMAVYGTTFEGWDSWMKDRQIAELQNRISEISNDLAELKNTWAA